jgi:dimethylhistidine N-methyltransferase
VIADDVRRGLGQTPKSLPPHLFYDDEGSRLYELITELPEYYLTRAERAIFEADADAIVACASGADPRPLTVVELGAGSATKSEVILRAVLRRQARCLYVPIDVSRTAVEQAERRLRTELPAVRVRPLIGTHDRALVDLRRIEAPVLALFIGSSVGNLEDAEAVSLLRGLRAALGAGAALVLGTDLRKSPQVLLPAYDDAAGVTAAFNKNVLTRINRELGGRFDLDRFRHVARWNDSLSRIEMHLESLVPQEVAIDALGLRVRFDAGETIHTESSVKYAPARVERLLTDGGLVPVATFHDPERLFAVHLARTT